MNKLQLAETTTDPVILDELSKNANYLVRWDVALNSNTSPETLDYLSKDEVHYVRCNVASNLNTSPETLDYLSRDKHWWVRCNVARNPNTTPETLKEMAKVETNVQVKYYIKNNHNCSEETYKYLSALEILKILPEVST
jgi:hypothetical protein